MNSKSLEQARNLVKSSYVGQGDQAVNGRKKMVGSTKYLSTAAVAVR